MDINRRVIATTSLCIVHSTSDNHHVVMASDSIQALALTGHVGDKDDAESKDDARRIAALWNACVGIPTDELVTTIQTLKDDQKRFEWFMGEVIEDDPVLKSFSMKEFRELIDKKMVKGEQL